MGVAPGHQAVVLQYERMSVRGLLNREEREGESGANVRDEPNLIAEDGRHRFAGVRLIRQRTDRVGVDVVHVVRGKEGVQEGLHRWPARAGTNNGTGQMLDDGVVVHRFVGVERQERVEIQRDEVLRRRRSQICSTCLDPENGALSARWILDRALRRRVSAAMQDEISSPPELAGACHQAVGGVKLQR